MQNPIDILVQSPEREFHTLDALRGVAAIGVVAFHLPGFFMPLAVPGGYLAVDLFFVMSGVVLAHAYERRFSAGMTTFRFLRTRLTRLYPLYFLGTVLGVMVSVASFHGNNVEHWDGRSLSFAAVLAFLVLPYFSRRPDFQLFPLNAPCWSLFFEIVINVVYARTWILLTSRRLVAFCMASGGGVIWIIAHRGHIDQGAVTGSFLPGLVRTAFGFSAGVLIARLRNRANRRESNVGFLGLLAVAVIAIAGWPAGDSRGLWDGVCVLIVFPLLVYGGTLIDPSKRLQLMATFLGVTSYALYVLHAPIAAMVNSGLNHHVFAARAPYVGLALVVFLLPFCWLMDRFFDAPVRRVLSRIVPKVRVLPSA